MRTENCCITRPEGTSPEFETTADPKADVWAWLLRAGIVLGLVLIFYSVLSGRMFRPLMVAAAHGGWSEVVLRPSLLWLTMGTLLLGFRTFLWFRYRPRLCKNIDWQCSRTVLARSMRLACLPHAQGGWRDEEAAGQVWMTLIRSRVPNRVIIRFRL